MSSVLDAALAYHRLGLVVVPLKKSFKHPLHDGWNSEGSQTEARVRELFENHGGNIGIACGSVSRLVVVDIDVKKDKDGYSDLAAWETRHGKLPETYTVGTPSGGQHRYFWLPPGKKVLTNKGMGHGIDVMGDTTTGKASQVAAPPTVLVGEVDPSGKPQVPGPYTIVNYSPIADFPEHLLHLLPESKGAPSIGAESLDWTPVLPKDPTYAKRVAFQRHAFSTEPVYRQGEHENGKYRYVLMLRRLGPGLLLDAETTMHNYAECYDTRLPDGHRWLPECQDEFVSDPLRRAYSTQPDKGARPDETWQMEGRWWTDPDGTPTTGLATAWLTPGQRALRIGDTQQLRLATGFPSVDTATRGGFLLRKLIAIGGAPGSGKTAMAVRLAYRWLSEGVHVAFLAADEDPDAILIRFGQLAGLSREALEKGSEDERKSLARWCDSVPFQLVDGDEEGVTIEAVSRELRTQARGKPSAFIGDSIQTMRTANPVPKTADARSRIDDVVRSLKRVAKVDEHLVLTTSEIARAAYRNTDQSENVNPLAAFKESGSIEYGVAMALVLRSRQGTSELVDAVVAKNRMGPGKPGFLLKLDHVRADVEETANVGMNSVDPLYFIKLDVLEAVKQFNGVEISKTQIYERVGGKKSTVIKAIDKLLEEKKLHQGRLGIRPPLPGDPGYKEDT